MPRDHVFERLMEGARRRVGRAGRSVTPPRPGLVAGGADGRPTVPTAEPGSDVVRDGRSWRTATAGDVAWLAGEPPSGVTIATAIPLLFDAYATFHPPDGVGYGAHERAVVETLVQFTAEQPWWLGYLDTGGHDVVFPHAHRMSVYWDWSYVVVEAGPDQALSWRRGHIRGDGALPDLFFPADRSWLVSALWDDTWTDIGAPTGLAAALEDNPLVNARRVAPDVDCVPPGLTRY